MVRPIILLGGVTMGLYEKISLLIAFISLIVTILSLFKKD